jgi:hypothetical protein
MFFAEKWNNCIDWSRLERYIASKLDEKSTVIYLEYNSTDSHGNRTWPLTTTGDLRKLLKEIDDIPENSIIFLPFDQQPGIMKRLLADKFHRDELAAMMDLELRHGSRNERSICIHIRRGDCTQERFPEWYVGNKFYIDLIQHILGGKTYSISISICTQGQTDWLEETVEKANGRVSIYTTKDLFLNDTDIRDFTIMINSEVLVASGSSFSRWAGIFGNNIRCYDVSRIDAMPPFKTYSPDSDPIVLAEDILPYLTLCEPAGKSMG